MGDLRNTRMEEWARDGDSLFDMGLPHTVHTSTETYTQTHTNAYSHSHTHTPTV